ncbi:hypothetical protein [Nonomuraea angiospora]
MAVIEEFGDAKITARKAIKGLRDEGKIYTRPDLGSFVGPEPDDEDDRPPSTNTPRHRFRWRGVCVMILGVRETP